MQNPRAGKSADASKWWKEVEENYPILSSLAKSILTIQITSVASEELFSLAGNIIT